MKVGDCIKNNKYRGWYIREEKMGALQNRCIHRLDIRQIFKTSGSQDEGERLLIIAFSA